MAPATSLPWIKPDVVVLERWENNFIALFNPTASRASWSTAVPELTATAYEQPTYLAKSASNVLTFRRVVSHPERKVSTTACVLGSPISGMWNGKNSLSRNYPF